MLGIFSKCVLQPPHLCRWGLSPCHDAGSPNVPPRRVRTVWKLEGRVGRCVWFAGSQRNPILHVRVFRALTWLAFQADTLCCGLPGQHWTMQGAWRYSGLDPRHAGGPLLPLHPKRDKQKRGLQTHCQRPGKMRGATWFRRLLCGRITFVERCARVGKKTYCT